MRPLPIDKDDIWQNAHRHTIMPPSAMVDEISPVEIVCDVVTDQERRFVLPRASIKLVLEGDDLDKLQAGGHVWISLLTSELPPMEFHVVGPEGVTDGLGTEPIR